MAGEIHFDYGTTGKTIYALVLNSSGNVYNGATFEAPLAANWATYKIALTEQSTTAIYLGTFPVVAAGEYGVSVRLQAGGSAATTDAILGSGIMEWDGTAEILPASRLEYTSARATKLDNLDAAITTRTKPADTQAAVTSLTNAPTAGDFTATMKTSLNNATPAVTVSDKTGFSLSTAGILAIWHQLTSAIVTASTIGKLIVDNLDATISSRMATYTQPTGFLAATFPSGTVANTTNITAGTITTTTNLTTNNDKTGYALTSGEHTNIATDTQTGLTAQGYTTTRAGYLDTLNGLVQAIWDKATSALTVVGSIGKLLATDIDATISSRTKPADTQAAVTLVATTTTLTNDPFTNASADLILDRANGVEASFTLRQALRLMLAAMAGKLSGAATTTVTIRDVGDTKNRIIATVDANGNRTAVTRDVS